MTNSRSSIPSKIKRKVRQRCGFGCVICGLPLYEYDHLLGYANVKRHKASELTLLCPNHHSMKTKGLLSDEQVVEFNRLPHNLKKGITTPFKLDYTGDSPKIMIAGLTFVCTRMRSPTVLIPIMIEKVALFGFTIDNGGLLLNMEVRDLTGQKIFVIENSELVISSDVWDVTMVGNTLRIQEGLRKSIVELEFKPPNIFCVNEYSIAYKGITVGITKNKIAFIGSNIPNINLAGDGSFDANVGILVGAVQNNLSVAFKIADAC